METTGQEGLAARGHRPPGINGGGRVPVGGLEDPHDPAILPNGPGGRGDGRPGEGLVGSCEGQARDSGIGDKGGEQMSEIGFSGHRVSFNGIRN